MEDNFCQFGHTKIYSEQNRCVHGVLSCCPYLHFITLHWKKPEYRLLKILQRSTITERFLQTGRQMWQELPALYKLASSFQQKLYSSALTKTWKIRV